MCYESVKRETDFYNLYQFLECLNFLRKAIL